MIPRKGYFEQLEPFEGKKVIKVLTGVRRSGKSTLLAMLAERFEREGAAPGGVVHLRLESESCSRVRTAEDLSREVRSRIRPGLHAKVLLDEVQEVEGWERALRSFLVDLDADVYVTGSNAHVLSSDLATYITGRYVTVHVFPLSFAEFCPAWLEGNPGRGERDAFRAYAAQGGFPFQAELGFSREPMLKYLDDLYSTILLKDVVKRNGIRDVDLLERLVRYALAEEGRLLSVKSIADYLKSERRRASQETVANYLDAAERAYLLYRVRREDAVGKRALAFNEKWYPVDQGLRQALGMDNAASIDQVLEGVVFLELKRRGFDVTVGRVGEREVDFVARAGGRTEYYQVSYLAADPATREREFGALEALRDSYPKTVLSLDEFPYSRGGVEGRNLVDWLLGK